MTLGCHHQKFRDLRKDELAQKVGEEIECDVCGARYKVIQNDFQDRFLLKRVKQGSVLR